VKLNRREAVLGLGAAAITPAVAKATTPAVTEAAWGRLSDGRPTKLFTLTNSHGVRVRITDYGGIVVSFEAPDRDGRMADIALGFDSIGRYETDSPMFGAVVGRYANRIGHGRFTLDGRTYEIPRRYAGPHALHGGLIGWDKAVWRSRIISDGDGQALELTHVSPDGDQGFPGAIEVKVTYRLTEQGGLVMEATAVTDAPTVINMTNHSYFNLAGHDAGEVLDQVLEIEADSYTVFDETNLPTGEVEPVRGTGLDFTKPKPMGRDIVGYPRGYDHNYVVRGDGFRRAARAADPSSGRTLEVWTDQPGIQLYTANSLNVTGKAGVRYGRAHGFCLEPQHFPDSPNRPEFPSTVLRPGETFHWRSEFRVGIAA
jgi:aldose 1-epimerase